MDLRDALITADTASLLGRTIMNHPCWTIKWLMIMIDLADVVQKAATGDETAWNTLVDRYAEMLTNIGHSFRLSPEQAQDAIQDTWLELLRHIGSVRDPERIGGWLATTMRRGCLRARHRHDRETPCSDWIDWSSAAAGDIDEQLLRKERHAILSRAVDRLPERQRDLLTALVNYESYETIGTTLNIPVGSIGPTRARAVHRLRSDLAAKGEGAGLLDAS
jgi:RNA polymerase sigma factor (sigma-70 family)